MEASISYSHKLSGGSYQYFCAFLFFFFLIFGWVLRLVSAPGIRLAPLAVKVQVLTTKPPGNSPLHSIS